MVIKNPFVEVLSLSVEERLALMEYLWDSITEDPSAFELSEPQRRDLDARLESFRRNPQAGFTWESVKAHIVGPR